MDLVLGIFLIIGLAVGGWYFRRYMKDWLGAPEEPGGVGFSLSDLRAIHASGKMTQEEFERAKLQLLQGIKAPENK